MPTDDRATGLILRTRPLTETSLIVHWLTRDAGRLATVAKGARRNKSAYRGKLDLFYAADFSFHRSRRSELHTLKELQVIQTYQAVRRDIFKLRQAAYAATLIEQTTQTDTPLPGLYQQFHDLLATLETQPWKAWTPLIFEILLIHFHGLTPLISGTSLSPGVQAIYHRMNHSPWSQLHALHLSPIQFRELDRFLNKFLVYHFDRLPKSRPAALKMETQTSQ